MSDRKTQQPQTAKGRRRFLRDALTATAAASVARCFPDVGGSWAKERDGCYDEDGRPPIVTDIPVVEIYDEGSVVDDEIQPEVVERMMTRAMTEATTGEKEPWQEVFPDFTSEMRIGLKVNCLNPDCPTSVPVVQAVIKGLRDQLGIAKDKIIVWDRRLDELEGCGFTEEVLGVPVIGTVTSSADKSSGPGYEADYCLANGRKTRLSRILTELTDLTINVPVLKTHGISGITAAMKNMYGVIDNPADFHDRPNDHLPALYDIALIRNSMRFNVVDALIAVTTGGTASPPDDVPKRIYVSSDPVATDSHALTLINEIRAAKVNPFTGDPDPEPPIDEAFVAWLDNAVTMKLGTRDYALSRLT